MRSNESYTKVAAQLLSTVTLVAVAAGTTARAQEFYEVIDEFTGIDGAYPLGELAIDTSGNLYGVARDGGKMFAQREVGCGAVFAMSRTSDGRWMRTVLHEFDFSDGQWPSGGLTIDSAGNLYGVANWGGTYSGGVVFELSRGSTGAWSYSLLHQFGAAGDGEEPAGKLIFDAAGNFYGTTMQGGASGKGTVFELSPTGTGWSETVLYSFTGGADGGYPYFGLTLATPVNPPEAIQSNSSLFWFPLQA